MHEGMDGQHQFEITVETDSSVKPVYKLQYRAFWGNGLKGS